MEIQLAKGGRDVRTQADEGFRVSRKTFNRDKTF